MSDDERQEAERMWREIVNELSGTWPLLKYDVGGVRAVAAARVRWQNEALEEAQKKEIEATMGEELKSCPYCGSPGKRLGGPTSVHRQYFTGCRAVDEDFEPGTEPCHGFGAGKTQEEADANWNRRAVDAAAWKKAYNEAIDEMRDAAKKIATAYCEIADIEVDIDAEAERLKACASPASSTSER